MDYSSTDYQFSSQQVSFRFLVSAACGDGDFVQQDGNKGEIGDQAGMTIYCFRYT